MLEDCCDCCLTEPEADLTAGTPDAFGEGLADAFPNGPSLVIPAQAMEAPAPAVDVLAEFFNGGNQLIVHPQPALDLGPGPFPTYPDGYAGPTITDIQNQQHATMLNQVAPFPGYFTADSPALPFGW